MTTQKRDRVTQNTGKLVTYVPAIIENPLLWGQCRPQIWTMRKRLLHVFLMSAALVPIVWLFFEAIKGRHLGALIGAAFALLFTGISDPKRFDFHQDLKFVVTPDTIYFNKRPPVPLNTVAHVSGRKGKVVLHRLGLKTLLLKDVVEAERVRALLTELTKSPTA